MTAKEFLGQALRLDKRIKSKLEQIESLRELATRVNVLLKNDNVQSSACKQSMESIIGKIVDLEKEMQRDIDNLLGLKTEIIKIIKEMDNIQCQMVLEHRYLCFKSWDDIAEEMGYCRSNVLKLHNKAIKSCDNILKLGNKIY